MEIFLPKNLAGIGDPKISRPVEVEFTQIQVVYLYRQ